MVKNILEYFEKTVSKYPEKTAIIDKDRSIDFEVLLNKALSIGTFIYKNSKKEIKQPIGVFLPKSIESIIADIGIVYSGNAYMNLDIKTPLDRIKNILNLVEPLYIITSEKYKDDLSNIFNKDKILLIEELLLYTNDHDALLSNLENVIDTDPLCLINTSGSTGTPKSVVLNHRSFIDYVSWAIKASDIKSDEILGSLAPIVFDHSSYELCLMMVHSCTLVLIPETYAIFPAKLLQYIAEQNVTYIFWVPTIMVNIVNMDLLSRIALPELRLIWFAGEVFPTQKFNYWRKYLPKAKFVNLYGPTEITVDCTYYIINRDIPDEEPIPIGYPCRNTDVIILDVDNNKVTEPNIEGELCVRGSSLAMGYYNNPEKTATVFVQNPLNRSYPELIYRTGDIVYINNLGEIVYKGRNDSLIKHMGKRIELGEIEHTIINTLGLVKNGCAVYDYKKHEIVFFYESDREQDIGFLRTKIIEKLPAYMTPTKFIFMRQLPRNTNGKIDRLQLKNAVEE